MFEKRSLTPPIEDGFERLVIIEEDEYSHPP